MDSGQGLLHSSGWNDLEGDTVWPGDLISPHCHGHPVSPNGYCERGGVGGGDGDTGCGSIIVF